MHSEQYRDREQDQRRPLYPVAPIAWRSKTIRRVPRRRAGSRSAHRATKKLCPRRWADATQDSFRPSSGVARSRAATRRVRPMDTRQIPSCPFAGRYARAGLPRSGGSGGGANQRPHTNGHCSLNRWYDARFVYDPLMRGALIQVNPVRRSSPPVRANRRSVRCLWDATPVRRRGTQGGPWQCAARCQIAINCCRPS